MLRLEEIFSRLERAENRLERAEAELKQLRSHFEDDLLIFGLNASAAYARKVAGHLGVKVAEHEEKYHEDGEVYVQSNVNVRGRDIFVIQSLYSDAEEDINSKFLKLLMFVGSLRDASAKRITLITPNLIHSRQDRKTASRAPIATKYTAQLIEAMRGDRILTIDVHNLAAAQNAFRKCIIDNLESKNLHADWCAANVPQRARVAILSPDSGGYARAVRFSKALSHRLQKDIEVAVLGKTRIGTKVTGSRITGDVSGCQVIIYDDMISTGSTVRTADRAVIAHGGEVFSINATHGYFVGHANEHLQDVKARIVVCDTIPPIRLNPENQKKVVVISTTEMVAESIKRIHKGTGSISDLLV